MSITGKISEKINEKNRNFVIGGIMLGIFLLFYFLGVGPQISTLSKVNPKIKILKQDMVQAKDDISKVDFYKKEIERLENELEMVNNKVKTKEEVPSTLEEISRLAKKHDVTVDQMMPRVEAQDLLLENQEGKYYALPILVEASSGYHNFGKFLFDLEADSSTLTIDRFTFSARENDRKSHSARLTLKAVIFEKKDN